MNPLQFTFAVDWLSLIFALLISLLFALSTVYSFYIHDRKYYSLLLLDLSALLLAVFSKRLLAFYVFLEISTIITYFLIIHKETAESISGGFKYLVVNIGGASLIFLSILFTESSALASGLFVTGCLVKIGSFPIHFWLVDAHPAAHSPVSALLSGIMVKIGFYGIFRFFSYFESEVSFLVPIALASMIYGAFLALVQSDIKRILAYCTVSQLGFVLLGIALGSDIGTFGGMLHLVNHAVFKSLLFLSMGCVIYATGERTLSNLGGLKSALPITAAACLIGCLSISGIPPFNGFASKSILFYSLESNIIRLGFLIASGGTVASFIKLFTHTFLGRAQIPTKKVPIFMKVPLIVLSGVCIVLGFFPSTVLSLMGVTPEWNLWSISALTEAGIAVILGIALYFLGIKTGIILKTPHFRLNTDEIFCMSGRAVEFVGRKLNSWLQQDINYYATYIVLFLIFVIFLCMYSGY